MSKAEWQTHWREAGKHDTASCPECAKRRQTQKANSRSRDRSNIYRDLGMVRVKGGWE